MKDTIIIPIPEELIKEYDLKDGDALGVEQEQDGNLKINNVYKKVNNQEKFRRIKEIKIKIMLK